jgi:hypothetical protein
MLLFRRTRHRVTELLAEVRQNGHDRVCIEGDGDIAEVIRLTCLEHGIKVEDSESLPALQVRGWKVYLHMDGDA